MRFSIPMKDNLFKPRENNGNFFFFPRDNLIQNLIARFERSRSADDLPGRARNRTVYTDAALKAVRYSILEDASATNRCRSSQLVIEEQCFRKFWNCILIYFHTEFKCFKIYFPEMTHVFVKSIFALYHSIFQWASFI